MLHNFFFIYIYLAYLYNVHPYNIFIFYLNLMTNNQVNKNITTHIMRLP